jgi:RimJ/RimL family protein N-acetyltransferase
MSDEGERFLVEWPQEAALLRLVEPTREEVRLHAAALADYYNEPVNRALMTNECEFSAEEVREQFDVMQKEGGRAFLLFDHDVLLGDCDFRHVEGPSAEFAIMVGARAQQAKGFGTSFAIMVHRLGFERLGLDKVYASVRPENLGSLRMLGKVGYLLDPSPEARRFAEEDDDLCLSVGAAAFARAHAARFAAEPLRIRLRAIE